MHKLAARERWRDRQFQAAIAGVDLGPEPEWHLGGTVRGPAVLSQDDPDYQAWRQRREQKGGGSGG